MSSQIVDASDNDLLLSTSEKDENRGPSNNGSAYSAPSYGASSNHQLPAHSPQSSLAIDDLLGLGLAISPNPEPLPPSLTLNPRAVLDPSAFQQKWRQLPISVSQEYMMNPHGVAALTTPQSLLRHMQGHSIHCIASGGQAPNFKYFFFAQKAEESSTFLVECVINSSSCKAQLKIKADDESTSQAFSDLFQSALSTLGTP